LASKSCNCDVTLDKISLFLFYSNPTGYTILFFLEKF
jgi:hypothetical protein